MMLAVACFLGGLMFEWTRDVDNHATEIDGPRAENHLAGVPLLFSSVANG
jgi:hypothetical protein